MNHALHADAWRARAAPVEDRDPRSTLDRLALRARQRFGRAVSGVRTELDLARAVAAQDAEDRARTDAGLREAADRVRSVFARGRAQPEDTVEAIWLVRESVRRTTGLTLHAEQVAAGMAMHRGAFAEMQTGEGKTLAAVIPATLLAWRGRGCHVLTANDYLVQRDRDLTAPVYRSLGLTAGAVVRTTDREGRQRAYRDDITYVTPREACADHLRERIETSGHRSLAGEVAEGLITGDRAAPVQRGLHAAIVDEADALLIDEGVTPLVLSFQGGGAAEGDHNHALVLADTLEAGRDYTTRERHREVDLTRRGHDAVAHAAQRWGGSRHRDRDAELVLNALRARLYFDRDRDYVVRDGRVVIVDQFTGRTLPDRTWRQGLHQAVEAKEGLDPSAEHRTGASLSFQRFVARYEHLCGTSGTLREAARELHEVFGARTRIVPTHQPARRTLSRGALFAHAHDRDADTVRRAEAMHQRGRPVLVGTRSVASSERISALLNDAGIAHSVLNAVRHEREATVIAEAGRAGAVTVATNMAGRGTDIPLDDEARAAGGLHVIVSEMNEADRVDRQLLGRAARQGDPGSGVVLASLQDDVVRRALPRGLLGAASRLAYANGRLAAPLARVVTAYARSEAQRAARAQRARLRLGDDRTDDALAFSGSPA